MTTAPTQRITDSSAVLMARRRDLERKEAPMVQELAKVSAKARHKPELPRDKAWWALSAGAVPACMAAGLPWLWSPEGPKLPVLVAALAMAALLAWVQRSWHACAVASQHRHELPIRPQKGTILLCSLAGATCALAGVGGLRDGLDQPTPLVIAALAGVLLANLGLMLLWSPMATFSESLRGWAKACARQEELQSELGQLRRHQSAVLDDLQHLALRGAGVHPLLQAPMTPQSYAQAQRLERPLNSLEATTAPPGELSEGPSTLTDPLAERLFVQR